MRAVFKSEKRREAQTLVFFILAFGTIILLCGLAIDSGLLYLSKARMGRAVDGAALAAVGNFNRSPDPLTNRNDVATIMRNFAVANYTDLGLGPNGGISMTPTISQTSYPLSTGGTGTIYTYNFNDGTTDANGQFKRFVQLQLTTGSGGQITTATCNARCPVHTYFIGFAGNGFQDLKVSSSAIATRNPRLIMIVIDRSASMLQPGGGAFGLAPAIVTFLDFFDTSSDNVGIVSFGSSARLEMPLTTNFIIAGTNNLINSYDTNGDVPAVDPEYTNNPTEYNTGGVRRLKFGGCTAADEGIRLGLEQLMANAGFNDPDVVKYMVIFTDGKWNQTRTLLAGPGYTNIVTIPYASNTPPYAAFVTNLTANAMANGHSPGAWVASTNLVENINLLPVPTLSPMPDVTNALNMIDTEGIYYGFPPVAANHMNDFWESADNTNEPLSGLQRIYGGDQTNASVSSFMGSSNGTNYYTHNLDVWLQPGAVDYVYHGNATTPYTNFVSNWNDPTNHINLNLPSGDRNVLVVPGYIVDGLAYDGLDLGYDRWEDPDYPRFRCSNYQEAFMWPDDTATVPPSPYIGYLSASLERNFMFRNYANLLTGFYVYRPDEPTATYNSSAAVNYQGIEPLITETNNSPRPLYGLGPYYPCAGFYWPFDLVGNDWDTTYGLRNPTNDPSFGEGQARHASYSLNMLSTSAVPEWSGELFYKSTTGLGTTSLSGSGTTPVSTLMTTADWKVGAPGWVLANFDHPGITVADSVHNTNILTAPSVWRPDSFNGSNSAGSVISYATISPNDPLNYTGGYVSDGAGHYYRNAMAWSGRPTHYYDFSQAKWIPVGENHTKNSQFLPLGNWKAQELAWHARAQGVTIFTVGYGQLVGPDQQVLLAQMANSTNTTAGNPQDFDGTYVYSYTPGPGTSINYNASQPIGQEFYATNGADISNDFYSVGQAINAALTE